MANRYCFLLILIVLLSTVVLAQPFVIDGATVIGKGGRSQTITPAQRSRPGESFDDWWYDDVVDCIRTVGCVDIVFCVDTSGSMAGAINSLQDEIERFAYDIAAVGFDPAFGYVSYCEVVNFPHGTTLFEDLSAFSAFLAGARSGDGGWEHHSDAIYQAIDRFNWRPGCEHIVIMVTDECDDASTVTPTATINKILAWGGTVYAITADCGDVDDFRTYCDTSFGTWFDYGTSSLTDVFDQIVDDIAEVEEILITVTNTSGGTLSSVTAELVLDFCLDYGDSTNPATYGPLPNGASHTFRWDIEEIPGCRGWGDCFIIRVSSGSYSDSIIGCVWVEDCGCPGPEAVIICPELSGRWTACQDQYIEIEYEGYIGVDPNTLCIRVEGTTYCYPSPNLTWTSGGARGGVLRFTPSAPGWSHLQTVNVECISGEDATGCPQRFLPESDFKVDIHPPKPVWWEHFPATWIPPRPARREARDGTVSWNPPCGSTLDSTDHIIISALLYDDGVGMTPLDAILSDLDFSELATLDFAGLWASLTSINVTVNGIPFIPGVVPGSLTRTVDLDATTYLLNPDCWFGGWHVACTLRADTAAILGLAFLTGGEVEICLNANDLVEADGCMPCENETSWCCTYYIAGSIPLIANAGPDHYICLGTSVVIGGSPPAGGGTEPYSYSWSPSTGLSSTTAGNPTASPSVTTTYVLTVTDHDGTVDRDTMTVYVSDPSANAGRDTSMCPGGYVQLGGSPTASGGFAPYTYSWSPTTGLSSSTTANPMFTSGWVTSDTTITFTVTVTDTLGCVDTDVVTVTIARITVDAGEDRRICVGDMVTLGGSPTASGGIPPYGYSWTATPPGSVFSTVANPTVSPTDTTMYVLTVTGGDPSCTSFDTVWVYPVQPVADAGRDTVVCAGEEIYIGGYPTASGGIPPYTYYWTSVPPSFSSTEPNPLVSLNNPTEYVVHVIDSLGCEDWDTVFVDVVGAPFGYVERPFPCGGITSCEYQTIVWIVVDTTSAIVPSSLDLLIDGVSYGLSSPEVDVFDMGDSIRITFTPSLPWMHGSTVVFELLHVENAVGCAGSIEPCEFIVDIHPPLPHPPVPPDGSVLYSSPDSVGVFITDEPAGVDPESFDYITIQINGIPAVGWTTIWDGSYLSFTGLDIEGGDSVVICLDNLYDSPTYDYCPPNDTSWCWWFMVLPCDLDITAYPDTVLCGGGVVPLGVDVEGGSGFISYSWTPIDGLDDPTIAEPTATVSASVNYTVMVTDDSLDCSVTDVVRIVVSNPVAHAGNDGMICPFSEIPLGDLPVATGGFEPYTFEWFDLSGTLLYDEANPVHTFGDAGETFVLRVVDSIGCEAWDTVIFSIDYESPLGIGLITPMPSETVFVGGTTFEWMPDPTDADMLYDFILDGTVVFSGIDSTHVTIDFPCGETHNWMVIGISECFEMHYSAGETTWTAYADTLYSDEWIFYTEDCTEPRAIAVHVPDGDWTACDPDSIVAFILDTTEIVESSIVMTVNGSSYRTSDPELEWDGDSTLVFRPTVMWADGEIISVCVDSAVNIDGIPLVAPVCWEFYIDRTPPAVVSAVPAPGSEISPMTDNITICVRDNLSGLDSVYVDVYGDSYALGPFACVDTVVCFDIPLTTPLPSGDTIPVNITRMTDCPDWCGPNVGDSSWVLIVSDCELSVIARPDTNLCSPDSVVFEAIVSDGSGVYSFHWFPEAIFADPFVQNPTGWAVASGWVRVEVIDDSTLCFAQDSVRVVVSDLVVNAGEDGRVCPGAALTLGCDPTASGGIEPYSYSWSVLGGAVFSTSPNPDYTFGSSSVSIILEVTDAIGCVAIDTVRFTIDYVPITGINLIEPLAGSEESPGDVLFRWAPVPAGAIATYDFYLDGVLISTQDSTRYTIEFPCGETHSWQIIGYTDCGESFVYCGTAFSSEAFDTAASSVRPFTTSPCGVPSATYRHVPNGDWTACNPDSIVWRIVDSTGIDPTSIVVHVNGTRYTVADPELTYMPAVPMSRLRFDPSPMWPSGATVNACLDSLMNLDSIWLPAPVCGEFYTDREPPVVWSIVPTPGSTVIAATWTSLDFLIYDYLSGLNESTFEIIINGTSFDLASLEVSWDGDSVVSIDISSLGIDCDEEVFVEMIAGDSPDWCGPNWFADTFTIYTAPCGLTPTIVEPLPNTISACDDQPIIMSIIAVDPLCPIDPSTIVLSVDGADYTVASPELDWTEPLLTWAPPSDWTHGAVVNVSLRAVEDACGGTSDIVPLDWSFRIDLMPPIPTVWTPDCGSFLPADTGFVFHVILEDGPADIESVKVSIDGVDYALGGALTISGTTAEFSWNPVLDGGLTSLMQGQVLNFCVHTGDGGITYCDPHDSVFCCEYIVPIDTGIVIAEIVEPLPNTITACDDQQIVMTIQGSEAPAFGGILWINNYSSANGRLNCDGDVCYGILRDSLIARGFEITEIDESTILTDELLAPYGILVIGPAVTRVFDSPESEAVFNFVNNLGRRVLSIGLDMTVDHHNSLVSQFGLEHMPAIGPLYYWGEITGPVHHPHPVTDGVDRLSVGGTPFVDVIHGDCLALHNDSCIVGVRGDAGAGRVVLLADDQTFMDSHRSDVNITLHDNLQLGLNIFDWLNTASLTTICEIIPASIILRIDGVDYTVADGELDWSPDTLVFTPSSLWNHGDTVAVCLMQAEDECGAVLPSPVCWEFFVDLQAPVRTAIDPPCGRPVIPGMSDEWTITLSDDVAGILPGATSITLDGVSCPIDGPSSIRQRTFTFEWSPSDCGITLTPGDTVELCILTSDGPMDYCDPNDTIFCCFYPVVDTGGPVATIIRVRPDSVSACEPESIIVELSSAYPIVEPSIVLNVDGTSYTTTNPRLEWLDPFLIYRPDPDWNPHDTVRATLVSADDIFGNPCTNAPLSWTFYIDRVPPISEMIQPPPGGYTRNIRQEIIIVLNDSLAGVNPNTLVLVINGVSYYYGDFQWARNGLGGTINWTPYAHGIEFVAGDTVFIALTAEDSPDYCGPNVHFAEYMFLVEPSTPCLVVPNPFTPNDDGTNEIAIFDWPNMTTEGATIYIYTIRNVLVTKFDVPPQADYFNVLERAWDGFDDAGKVMPQGLYLYLIESDGKIVCNGTITLIR